MLPVSAELGESGALEDFVPGDDYFAALREPFGTSSVPLSIGPVRLRLEGLADEQAETLTRRFRPFIGGGDEKGTVSIGLMRAGVDGFLRFPGNGARETYRIGSRQEGPRMALWSYEFAGWLEAARRRAVLALSHRDGHLFERGLENFLRVLMASFVLEEGGFLLHGSGVVRGGRAYVFFGPSGSGKTTVTHLSPEDTVLSDDLTLVARSHGGYQATGIPFGLAHQRPPQTGSAFPIASLNRLVQSPEVRREPILGARAVAEVAGSLPFVMQEAGQAALAMEVVGRALSSLPVYRLHFRKDDSFWGVVEETY
jgi:hypothetical protein